MARSRNRIAYYRMRHEPALSQTDLGRALGKHRNTIYRWEQEGVAEPADLLRLTALFVQRGLIGSYAAAREFWALGAQHPADEPPELAALFAPPNPGQPSEQPQQFSGDQAAAAEAGQDRPPDPAPLPAGSRMALRRNPLCLGRDAELMQLAAALGEIDATVVITGVAGMGKTQLACEFAHRYGQFFPGGVFWISAADPGAIAAAVADCGRREYLGLAPDFDQLPIDAQVRLVQAAWRAPDLRLLVLDNCESEDLLAAWRPVSGNCRVLATSQLASWDVTLVSAVVPLGPLARPASVSLLQRYRAGHSRPPAPDQPGDYAALASELGDWPLALHLAGEYLAGQPPSFRAADYQAQLRRPDLLAAFTPAHRSPTGHHQQVLRAFAFSYQALGHGPGGAAAQALLARAAHFVPGEPIAQSLLLDTLAPDQADQAARARAAAASERLARLGLLQDADAEHTILHRLLGWCVREVARDPAALADVERAVLAEANQLSGDGLIAAMRARYPQLRGIADAALPRRDTRAADLAAILGWQLTQLSDARTAEPYLASALAIRRERLGDDHPDVAATLNLLGLHRQTAGQFVEAQPFFERALAIWGRAGAGYEAAVTAACSNLAHLLSVRGDYPGARAYFERALAGTNALYGDDDPATARVLNKLGYLVFLQGDAAGAAERLARALRICERRLPAEHPATAQVHNNFGEVLAALGQLQLAEEHHQRSLRMREALFGAEHHDVAESLQNLAALALARGSYSVAQQQLERALAICAQTLGPDHLETAWKHDRLGDCLAAQGRRAAAGACYQQALAVYRAQLGEQHPTRLGAEKKLAALDLE